MAGGAVGGVALIVRLRVSDHRSVMANRVRDTGARLLALRERQMMSPAGSPRFKIQKASFIIARVSDAQYLVEWFKKHARPLPWRTNPRDPYRSLVSELMAQQTQLDRVVPRFEAFMSRFPTLGDLAATTQEQVVEAWSGLGYYRRARMLHRLAREVAAGNGELPRTAAELEGLPGVGPYTAAAVASTVHGEAAPLMDGNVARVGARVLALADDPRKPGGRAVILEWVGNLMKEQPPGEVNEGLMELGATVCTPQAPRCDRCPLVVGCRGFAEGNPESYPPPRKLRDCVDLSWLAVIVEDAEGNWLLHRIDAGPILRGLWLPPFAEIDPKRSLAEQISSLLPFEIDTPAGVSEPIKHSITHRRIQITPVRVVAKKRSPLPEGWRWVCPRSPGLPTSSLLEKLTRRLGA